MALTRPAPTGDRDTARPSGGVRDSVLECVGSTPLVRLDRMYPGARATGVEVLAKLEMMNPGGSMKDRSARFIVSAGIADGSIPPGCRLVESSSGNFGVAVAMVARLHGLGFTCVVDPAASASNVAIMRGLGAEVVVVDRPDAAGGYLGTRLERVREIVATTPGSVWINQYANDRNWLAHYRGTGSELVRDLDDLDGPPTHLVMAVSTTGSLLGCARRLREDFPAVEVVAVDAVGSVLFGGPAGRRDLPGIGTSRVPELHSPAEIDRVVHVDDATSAEAARDLLGTEAIFAGGSSGAVCAAVRTLLPTLPRPARVVTVLADRGDRYLDRIWDDGWLARARERR